MTNNFNKEKAAAIGIVPNAKEELAKAKIGAFIILNTRLQKGLRLDLSKVRSYAKAGTDKDHIQIAYDSSGGTVLQCDNEKHADEILEIMDSYCL